jgi:ABC-2 type transport system permease protein
MSELMRVISNEWMKLLRRRRFWVTGILAVLTIALFSLVTYHDHRNQMRYGDPVQSIQNQITVTQSQVTELNKQPQSVDRDRQLADMQQNITQMKAQLTRQQQLQSANWQDSVKQEMASMNISLTQLQSGTQSADTRQQIGNTQMQLKQLQYNLDHNIKPHQQGPQSAYQSMGNFNDISTHIFLPLLVIILVADMVSGEGTDGTIKLLLVRPVSRTKIWLGKWIVSLFGSVIMTLVFFAAIWLAAIVIAGPSGGDQPLLTGVRYTFETLVMPGNTQPTTFSIPHLEHVVIVSQLNFFVTGVLYTALAMMAVATIGLFCSTLFKSAMASTAIAMGTVVIGFIVANMAQHQSWVGWLFPTHLDLWQNWSGELAMSTQQNLTLMVGLGVLTAWAVVTLLVSLWTFARRDVLNA